MDANLFLQILSLVIAACIPTTTFILSFGRLFSRVDNLAQDVAKSDSQIDKLEIKVEARFEKVKRKFDQLNNKIDNLVFFLMGHKPQYYLPLDKKE